MSTLLFKVARVLLRDKYVVLVDPLPPLTPNPLSHLYNNFI